ncbi:MULTISPECIES: NADH-quinone oxidoreductase subunit L [Thiomicrorhabdus]|uniref:Probable inorganic carbon transporter subunit DabB n=1 Tax=Thiomicrorhabdus heinhorstiae TaxID=2748010 RepID=A0ABS0C160_9GAMM|nr:MULTISPECIES: NADH-quinone oxidoreductase subunit L [Thiomicrorhabdus]MBF6059009.1 NADH-quinone oxidoreductase subunit L [Thiomicrorhabdus heinhorstiae]
MSLQWIGTLMAWFIPLSLFLAAITNERRASWGLARGVTLLGFMLAIFLGIAMSLGWISLAAEGRWTLASDASLIILGLVTFIGFINIGYSRIYMSGNAEDEKRYLRWLLVTLGSVAIVITTNHMLILVFGWLAITLSLHRLLIFYPNRQRAVLAAHKKYIFARFAEACLLGAVLILYFEHGTWFISDIYQNVKNAGQLNAWDQFAALLLALAALVKCAQLPLHGWLIQVVEAPTPVSALLHAGIINLGGYLLIIFAPLIVMSDAAQWMLLIVGGITTVLAALVMMTRVSVKVRLAWSTMSQMGLMMVECGLGLFELALLHLIAHSCYKAYAFLNSGSEVESSMKRRLAQAEAPSASDWWLAGLVSIGLVAALVWGLDMPAPYSPWLLFAIALTLLIAERRGRLSVSAMADMVILGVFLLIVYIVQKSSLGLFIENQTTSVGWLGDLWIALLLVLFMAGYIFLRYYQNLPWMAKVRRVLYAGFYLDELVTRLNLRIYPTRLPVRFKPKKLQIPKEELYH